jgi:anhydro-N-acetylmuramic acid kinase
MARPYFIAPWAGPIATIPRLGYSLQLGRGSEIARQTQVATVSDFRRADIEAGGEGAPLVPIVDQCLLSHPSRPVAFKILGALAMSLTYRHGTA